MSVLPSDDRYVVPPSVENRFAKAGARKKVGRSPSLERGANQLKLYEVSVSVALAAVSTTCEEDLFRSICDIISLSGEFELCWIGIADIESGIVTNVASAGHARGYVDDIEVNFLSGPRSEGPAGRAIRQQCTVVSNDISSDMLMQLSRDRAINSGFNSLIALPFSLDSLRRGVLMLYSTIPSFFSPTQVALLERLANIVEVAWQAILGRREYLESGVQKHDYERLLNRAVYTSPLAFAMLDSNNIIISGNAALCTLLDRPQEDIIGKHAVLFLDDSQQADAIGRLTNPKYDGVAVVTERMIVRRDRSRRWVRIHTSHIQGLGAAAALVQVEDIHEGKLAVDALSTYNTKLKNLLEDAPVSIFTLDTNGIVTLCAGGLRKYQTEFAELHIQEGEKFKLGDSAIDVGKQLSPLLQENGSFQGTVQLGNAYMELHLAIERNENKTEHEIYGVGIDVTDIHLAKDRLRIKAENASALLSLGQRLMTVSDNHQAISAGLECIQQLKCCRASLFATVCDSGNILRGEVILDESVHLEVELLPRQNQLISICLDEVSVKTLDLNTDAGSRGVAIRGIEMPKSIIMLPLVGRDSVLGLIVVVLDESLSPNDDFKELASGVMGSLNATIQRTELERTHLLEAQRDRMTQLLNRDTFRSELSEAINNLNSRSDKQLLVATLDIDRFKQINESLGHEVGDRVVSKIAQRLQECCNDTIILARTGGDEFGMFAIVDKSLGREELNAILQTALDKVAKPIYLVNIQLSVTASIGATVVYPNRGQDIVTVLSHIDIAMYEAKGSQQRIKFYSKKASEPTADNLIMLASLTRALEANELQVYLQPKMSLTTRRLTGFEALARWKHMTRGFIPPDQFVKMAEQTGQIRLLTEQILAKSVDLIVRLGELGYCLPIAINLSPSLFADETIADLIEGTLAQAGVDHSLIQLEFTETMSLTDPDNASKVFERLTASGFHFHIDDFGTGFSSLNHLRNVGASTIKIDRSYIDKLTKSEKDYSIVKGVIDLSHALSYTVVAEGVEDKETARALSKMGCDEIQGYLLAKPMPFDSVCKWLGIHSQMECNWVIISEDLLL